MAKSTARATQDDAERASALVMSTLTSRVAAAASTFLTDVDARWAQQVDKYAVLMDSKSQQERDQVLTALETAIQGWVTALVLLLGVHAQRRRAWACKVATHTPRGYVQSRTRAPICRKSVCP